MNSTNDDTENWRMTVKELRKFEGFENISEEEAEKVIDSLVQLALIVFEINLIENNK